MIKVIHLSGRYSLHGKVISEKDRWMVCIKCGKEFIYKDGIHEMIHWESYWNEVQQGKVIDRYVCTDEIVPVLEIQEI